MGQAWSQTFPPAAKYHVEDVPDLSGKVMIVTGGNSGIGKEIVRALLTHNAKVYLAARNPDKGKAAIEELKKDTGKEALYLKLDLASLNSVRNAAEEFLSKENQLNALFNNGGVMFLTSTAHALDVTEDGYDIQWGTNALGPFYFTKLLVPALLEAAKNSEDNKARVTFAASIVQTKSIKWDTLTDTPARKKMCADQRYGQAKFANVVLSREFARRYGDKGLVFTSMDPGGIKTDLQRHMPGLMRSMLNLMLHPPVMGALTHLWAATSPEAVDINGKVCSTACVESLLY
ncbi:NAD-binding protein, partial [Flammula alnicola]